MNATILVTVVRLWLSGWIQRHDPRQGPLKTAVGAAGAQRARSVGTAAGDPCGDFTVGIFNTIIRTVIAKLY